jgi:hypothetical protein
MNAVDVTSAANHPVRTPQTIPTDPGKQTIVVDSGGINTAGFGIQPADRQRLFDNDVAAVRAWLAYRRRAVPAP